MKFWFSVFLFRIHSLAGSWVSHIISFILAVIPHFTTDWINGFFYAGLTFVMSFC